VGRANRGTPAATDITGHPGRRFRDSHYSLGAHIPIMGERVTQQKGAGKTLTIDPFHVRRFSEWSDADFDLDDLELPAAPQWNRCGAVHCIDRGPWIGTLVCCIRRSGHEDGHSMSLGDEGAPDYWRETWL
jgi:hypothetical protein